MSDIEEIVLGDHEVKSNTEAQEAMGYFTSIKVMRAALIVSTLKDKCYGKDRYRIGIETACKDDKFFVVSSEFVKKYNPQLDGYLIKEEINGQTVMSCQSAEEFLANNKPFNGTALEKMEAEGQA